MIPAMKAATLELRGDCEWRDPVIFTLYDDGRLRIWIDGGETGDSENGLYQIEADRTLSTSEVDQLREFLARKKYPTIRLDE